jgi:hypothetical protein
MVEFNVGDRANYVSKNGEIEIEVIRGPVSGSQGLNVQTVDGGFRVFSVLQSELLPVRGPYFDIRGLVFTTSPKAPERTR